MKKAAGIVIALLFLMVLGGAVSNNPKTKYVPGELLVKFKPALSAEEVRTSVLKIKAEPIKTFRRIGVTRLKLPKELEVLDVLKMLREDPTIQYVEPNYLYTLDYMPNDPMFGEQWALHNTSSSGGTVDADMDAPEAWDLTQGDPAVIVAVTDTGVNYNHEDLRNNMWRNVGETSGDGHDNDGNGYVDDIHGYDFIENKSDPLDYHNHGTHVAGIIGGVGNNNIGITGINLRTQIMALKIFKPLECGGIRIGDTSTAADSAEAIIYAVDNGAKVINASWGGSTLSTVIKDAIAYADSAGVLFVAAAGNDGTDNDTAPHYPSNFGGPPHNLANVIAVAATEHNDNLTSFSNFGLQSVHLASPGNDILSTVRSGYGKMSGTSMAAPYVTGVAALVWSKNRSLSHSQVKQCVLGHVDGKPFLMNKVITGGRLNAFNAVGCNPMAENFPDERRFFVRYQKGQVPKSLQAMGPIKPASQSDIMKIALYYGLLLVPIGFIVGWKVRIRGKK